LLPIGVGIIPDGTKVYVGNSGNKTVSVISTTNDTVTTTIGIGKMPIVMGQSIAGSSEVSNRDNTP